MLLSRVGRSSARHFSWLIEGDCLLGKSLSSLASNFVACRDDLYRYHCDGSGKFHYHLKNIRSHSYAPCRNLFVERSWSSSSQYVSVCPESSSRGADISMPDSGQLLPDDDSNSRVVVIVQEILKSHQDGSGLESALDRCRLSVNEDFVVNVLRRHRSDWKPALSFFKWASRKQGYAHGLRAYNEMLDILGRMKQIKVMRQLFDEIPMESESVISERTFTILINRYAGAHKVEEAIEIFYKRKDYGFELDMIAFQTLLMSLCRYKHVEEAEALFIKKQDEFPPVIKSRNIILNGWCVMGSLHEAKRFWNDIISSGCMPDLFTYGTFINSLTKAGKISTARKLFISMWEKGYQPDVPICNCIIDGLCFKKRIPEALEIFGEMNERGCLPDVATYNSLIKHLCKIRRMEKVHDLLNVMEQKGCLPNARTYSFIFKTLKKPEEVTELLQRMERTGCRIDGDTCNLILNLYVQWNHQKGIQFVWTEMEKNGLGPDQRSYTIMIHGLYSQRNFDEALEYFSKMKSKGMIPEPRTRILVKAIHLKREEIHSASHSSSTRDKRGTAGQSPSELFPKNRPAGKY